MTNRLTVASRKLISILAIVAMVITSISFVSVQNNAYAATDTAQVGSYTIQVPDGADLPSSASESTEVNKITSNSKYLSSGWYVVDGTVTIGGTYGGTLEIEKYCDCNIILTKNAHLNCDASHGNKAGIIVDESSSLTIWTDTSNAGKLTASGGVGGAGIGGTTYVNSGRITINGGIITATGGSCAAGIGGGGDSNGNNITINEGTVTATGSQGADGIGSGVWGNRSNNTVINRYKSVKAGSSSSDATGVVNDGSDISGKLAGKMYVSVGKYDGLSNEKYVSESGTVNSVVKVGDYKILVPESAELPAGASQSTKLTTLSYGPRVNNLSTGWYVISELRYGDLEYSDRITINGDVNIILTDGNNVLADEGINVTGDSSLTIWSEMGGTGKLVASGVNCAAGIGGGDGKDGNNITINGGIVEASGGFKGAGIGGGNYAAGNNITINDGTVTATGGDYSTGIGGGNHGEGKHITINGGTVTATGDTFAAGIGGAFESGGYDIEINGGNVNATGKGYGDCEVVAIGHGSYSSNSEVTISPSLTVEQSADSKEAYMHIYANDDWNNSDVATSEKTSIKSLKSYKKSVKVTWATKTDVDGYQVKCGTNKSITKNTRTVTVKSPSVSSKTISKLKRHTRYYVKVRTYVIGSDGNRIYSDWSKVKSVKTR